MNRKKIKFSSIKASVLIALAIIGGFGCRSAGAPDPREAQNGAGANAEREFVDDLGRKISLPERVTKAVSLAPNLTEIIFAVGAGENLVGVTSFCNYPAEAEKIQSVGDTLKPNIENIIALKPQVVFVSTASQLEAFTKTLEEQNIDVFVTNPDSLEDIYRSIEKIGEIFGRSENARTLNENLKQRVARVENRAEKNGKNEKVKTFVQIDKSLYTIGAQSFLTDLIEKAGGASVTADIATAYPKISRERAFALDPEVIILSDSPDNGAPNEVFENSRAVKNERVFKIDADILSRPGPRSVDALERIAEVLHPGGG